MLVKGLLYARGKASVLLITRACILKMQAAQLLLQPWKWTMAQERQFFSTNSRVLSTSMFVERAMSNCIMLLTRHSCGICCCWKCNACFGEGGELIE